MRKFVNYSFIISIISISSFGQIISEKSNIIFFLVDDLGWTDLSCYGSSFYETPNIDKLAEEGVKFTNAYSTCSVCSPSRASILTGKYPASINLTDWLTGRPDTPYQKLKNVKINKHLPYSETTIAEVLKNLGYNTAILGKWHLGENPSNPMAHGFDLHLPNWAKGWPNKGYFAPFGLEGFEDSPKGYYLTDRLTDEALKYIKLNKKNNFFLLMSYFNVHDPIQGRKDLVEKYKKKLRRIKKSSNPDFILEGNPDNPNNPKRKELNQMILSKDFKNKYKTFDNDLVLIKQKQDNVEFAAMVESVDESIGKIINELKKLKIEENTIIIFYSDNGGMSALNGTPWREIQENELDQYYSTSNLPLRGAKGWLYEGGIRVPLIIKYPKSKKIGFECDLPISGVDMFPTIVNMLNASKYLNNNLDGINILPAVMGDKINRGPIYWHFPHYSNHGMQSPGGAIRDGDYKLLEYFENGTLQLYNLKNDLGEQLDLSKIEIKKTMELKKKLDKWRTKIGAKMMTKNEEYNPNSNKKINPYR